MITGSNIPFQFNIPAIHNAIHRTPITVPVYDLKVSSRQIEFCFSPCPVEK